MDIKILEELYSKYMFRDAQGIKSTWKNIVADYKDITGKEINISTARSKINVPIRERLWNDKFGDGKLSQPSEESTQPDEESKKKTVEKKTHTLPPSQREISGNGSQKLLAYQEMTEEDAKDPNRVMDINGFNPDEWDLIKLKVSEWTMGVKNHNYSISLEVKPKLKAELPAASIQELIDTSRIVPEYIQPLSKKGRDMLLIPLTDMHLGVADYDYYKPHQIEINDMITGKSWEEIVFTIGSDLFHNNDFRGQTASGTMIEKVDMEKAWDDALLFYKPLLAIAQKKALRVRMLYIKGNHDEAMSWAFVRTLQASYPNIETDTSFIEAKCIIYKNNAIVVTHGDKANDAKLAQVTRDMFEVEMNGKSKYIIRGHIHTQKMLQFGSINLYALGTAAKTDQWHQDNFYVGNMKQFELFTFNDNSLKVHAFVNGQ